MNFSKENKFPQSWYPVARACDLKKGKHQLVCLFGQYWLLFRTKKGKAGVISRRCCHMGADLGEGQVVGDLIECPLHGWKYNAIGKCVAIPGYTKSCPEAEIAHLLCEEYYGLIFIYWGNSPLFSFPLPPAMPSNLDYSAALSVDLATNYVSMSMNAFDIQHFERIHHRRFTHPPLVKKISPHALRVNFEVEIVKHRWIDYVMAALITKVSRVAMECWGGSLIVYTNLEMKASGLIALQPLTTHRCRAYLVALQQHQDGFSLSDKVGLQIAPYVIREFLRPDIRATRNMMPFEGSLIDTLDYGAKAFWDYWHQLPQHGLRLPSDH